MDKLLVVCGPTATGKTEFGIEMAMKLDGEIISADSRQVYQGMDVITGKDLPLNSQFSISDIPWRGRKLKIYDIEGMRVWMYDVVRPNEPFNVAFWHECAALICADVISRGKIPIVVGGTGLYVKSITEGLPQIDVPANPELRESLTHKSAGLLFNYLSKLDAEKAASLNHSDRNNPRRLIRAIEITQGQSKSKSKPVSEKNYDCLIIGLTASREELFSRVDKRVEKRMAEGAEEEVKKLVGQGYGWDLPSMSASGYRPWREYFAGQIQISEVEKRWKFAEHDYVRRQLTWFKKQKEINWFDIKEPGWKDRAEVQIRNWYNREKYATEN